MRKIFINLIKGITIGMLSLMVAAAAFLVYIRSCAWEPQKAAEYATQNAERKSVGLCAMYVRKAIIHGGLPVYKWGDAWTYKYLLPILGFEKVGDKDDLKVGDIVVFQPTRGRRFGHIAMWNGRQWVSDFRQRSIVVHSDYRKEGSGYDIFRKL